MIVGRRRLVTKNNKMMEFIQLEDMGGIGEIIVFPNTYEKYSGELNEDRVLVISGHLNFKEGEQPKIIADSVIDIDRWEPKVTIEPKATIEPKTTIEPKATISVDAVKIRIPAEGSEGCEGGKLSEEDVLGRIKEILKKYPGDEQVLIYKRDGKIIATGGTGSGPGVRPTLGFAEETALLVGNANVKIKRISR